MGDRGQVLIKDVGVYLYTHWNATDLVDVVKSALSKRERWNDPEYLARITFCEMVKDDMEGSTGYGIGIEKHPDVWRVVELDCKEQTISVIDDDKHIYKSSFLKFITMLTLTGEDFEQYMSVGKEEE